LTLTTYCNGNYSSKPSKAIIDCSLCLSAHFAATVYNKESNVMVLHGQYVAASCLSIFRFTQHVAHHVKKSDVIHNLENTTYDIVTEGLRYSQFYLYTNVFFRYASRQTVQHTDCETFCTYAV